MKSTCVVSMYWPSFRRTGEPSMIFSRAFCTRSPEGPRACALVALSCHLVDEDNAALRLLHVALGAVEQAMQDGLDFLADIFCLRQRRRVRRHERHIENPCQGFAEQRLAGTGRADEENIALHHLDRIRLGLGGFLEVRINRNGEDLLGIRPITCWFRCLTISLGFMSFPIRGLYPYFCPTRAF